MNVLVVHAHPSPDSLNGALKAFVVDHLERAGHAVEVSDLQAMGWNPLLDADAIPAGTEPPEVLAEQAKLRRADVVLLQFPLWWFTMPALLKGWVDRVFTYGFAYGIGEHSDRRWGDRYGEGLMAGKRAMLLVTTGGWEEHYGPRGINGPIDQLLFPIQHGILYYPGFTVLPPFLVHRTGKMNARRYEEITRALAVRLDTLATAAPIPYRMQNGGDYEIPAMTLRAELAPGESGFGVHSR